MKVARKVGDDPDIEGRIEVYARQLATWPQATALAVLEEHPKRSIYWPAWKELEDLRVEFEERRREQTVRIASPGGGESFTDRVTRLKLHRRLGTIGVGRWKVIMHRHRRIADAELLAAVARLELGHAAFPE